MKPEQTQEEQLDECREKIFAILKEYKFDIVFDEELDANILVDDDTNKFRYF